LTCGAEFLPVTTLEDGVIADANIYGATFGGNDLAVFTRTTFSRDHRRP
jgi:hypothetical protein